MIANPFNDKGAVATESFTKVRRLKQQNWLSHKIM
jgi:hypothetical protein